MQLKAHTTGTVEASLVPTKAAGHSAKSRDPEDRTKMSAAIALSASHQRFPELLTGDVGLPPSLPQPPAVWTV